ncbi:hypothetical protein B0H11DRAFT_1909712 [Mycena galericulata]|nr:hypothetical protein B0H11DRAFT_1909712 [Mycena galericulata]
MHVTLHTEIEPPGEASVPVAHPMLMRTECRPCPPLPLDGPILMEFVLHSQPTSDTLAPSSATSIVPISKDLELISTVPAKTSLTGNIQDSRSLSGFGQSPGTGISDAMAWDLSFGRRTLMWLAMQLQCHSQTVEILRYLSTETFRIQMSYPDFVRYGSVQKMCSLEPAHGWIHAF